MSLEKQSKTNLEPFDGDLLLMGSRDVESQDWETSFVKHMKYPEDKTQGLRLYMNYWNSARDKIRKDGINANYEASEIAKKLSFYDSEVKKLI